MDASGWNSILRNPPRQGRPFFLLWMGSMLVQAVLTRLIILAAGTPTQADLTFLFIAVAIVVRAVEAWLLFRPGWRFGLWIAIPLLSLGIPRTLHWVQLQGIIVPLLETPLLHRIRQRPWAWILVGMGKVIISVFGYYLVYTWGLDRLLNFPFLPRTLMQSGAITGIWLVAEAACVAVLAWKMPPLGEPPTAEPGTSSSLPPESKGE